MSASRAGKKVNILDKRVPENPKYKNVKAVVDTGASVTKYMERIEEIRSNYKYKKDEIFKRMKATTFAQLVLQVAEVYNMERDRQNLLSADKELIQYESSTIPEERESVHSENQTSVPPLNLGNEGEEKQGSETARSTLESLIHGVGEFDIKEKDSDKIEDSFSPAGPEVDSMPYLLLDLRDKDAFDQCHIIGAIHYPASMLSRSVNYFSKEILTFICKEKLNVDKLPGAERVKLIFTSQKLDLYTSKVNMKNKLGKIIILYDEDEKTAAPATTTFVQRGVDNAFMLSGGLKVLAKKFPEGLITGTLPTSCRSTPPPTRRSTGKSSMRTTPPLSVPPTPGGLVGSSRHVEYFTLQHLEVIQSRLDELLTQETSRLGSRISSRSATCASSRAPTASTTVSTASKKPSWK